ncbi:MAG TPA: ATP-binding protein [Anaerovoracaceae bacterium]|nr:ATP-binding protein [Anaerovoracaceae bacterium]
MKKKLFVRIIFMVLVVQLLSIISLVSILHYSSLSEIRVELKNEAEYLAVGYDKIGTAYFDNVEKIGENRITLIDKEGIVLYDNKANPDYMDNHNTRPEVIAARNNGYGESERDSDTLLEKTVYYALIMEDDYIIRVSANRITLVQMFLNLIYPIVGAIVIAIITTLILAFKLSDSIVRPINELNLEKPKESNSYIELDPLVDKINEQNELIEGQITELKDAVNIKTREANFRKEFTANVSHELKTPLTSISGYAELIKEGIAKEEDVPYFAEKIHSEAIRLIGLVGDIIKLSQMDENSVSLIKEQVDIYAICEKAVSLLEPIASANNISLELVGNHIYIDGVEEILEEIIYNLCDNAIKYNKLNGKVTIEVAKDSVVPYIKVEDTGIGMEEEELERVFERFYRVDKSHSKEIGGTGLGLSIVKHGVSYHNAEIEIQSEVGKGTTITVKFN